jgi:uncharacterized phage infection (PIP) family protein YhgE
MDFLGMGKKDELKVNVTPSPVAIGNAGKTLKNAVKTAQNVAATLNDVSAQLKQASNTLKKNAPSLASAGAEIAQDPKLAAAVAPLVGGANANIIQNLPTSVVVGGFRDALNGAAEQLNVLSAAATDGAKAVNEGLNEVKKGANWVAANASSFPYEDVNDYVNDNANRVLSGGAKGINSVMRRNVVPAVNLRANLGKSHAEAVKRVARDVASAVSRKDNRKDDRKAERKDRMNGMMRKNRKNVTRKNRKDRKNREESFFGGMW